MEIQGLRNLKPTIVVVGLHTQIIQSILDFDFAIGYEKPSVVAIIAGGRRYARFFYGKKEILLPVSSRVTEVSNSIKSNINMMINVTSGRRVLTSTIETIDHFENLKVGSIFAEGVPEKHAI